MRRLFAVIAVASACASIVAPANAAPRVAEPADLTGLSASGPIVDTVLADVPTAAIQGTPQVFVDPHGHRITLETAIPGLDLSPYADVLAATLHRNEIEDLVVYVVRPSETGAICGDAMAVACYLPEDPETSYRGWMWIPSEDEDLFYTIIHEYGHHVDNQLLNLAHLGLCNFASDGSRNWFFRRDVEDNVLGAGFGCNPDLGWDKLLGELYAEDFTWLNGNTTWALIPSMRPPSHAQRAAIAFDLAVPFEQRTLGVRRWISFDRIAVKRFSSRHWALTSINLSGRRRADFDLYLFRRGARRPIVAKTAVGSRHRIERILRPGAYEVVVHAYATGGTAALRVHLD